MVHTPEMISILKNTAGFSDEGALEQLSSKYDFLYIHPVSMPLCNFWLKSGNACFSFRFFFFAI